MSTTTADRHLDSGSGLRAARWLSMIAVVLVAAASAAGLWINGLYQDPESVAAMFRGYDLVTLVVVAPLLAATLLQGVRDRPRAQLLWVSMLAYCVYNYAYYVFGAEFNAAFLAHVAIVTVSIYALVLSLAQLDVAGLARRFRPRTPVRAVATILLLLAVPLAAIWISSALDFAITGVVPEDPSHLVVPVALTRLGAVLDLSLLVPAYTLAAILLWRRDAWGYLLATMMLVSGAIHQVSYIAAMVFQDRAGIHGAAFDPVEPVIAVLFLAASTVLLANMRRGGSDVVATTSEPERRLVRHAADG
jgi:hypothetical protein